ncbi:CdaR family transcriptional regulator [Nocardioides albertanoniae]|uniref:CdaR family transcriptional regulator n=1 Tax=Nocardioides albertanoniae TaxID=1175486 RepID=A0A543A722_9ACTN|nr:helix-turn-helix domain-containing protein [Nocardioides albertanoniae]TQL68413.1 CdaR family transcriptional regulator [Nocardioides albertanoniae]
MSTEPIRRIVAGVREGLPATVEVFLERTWDQVPAYVASPDPGLREDVADHAEAVFRAVLTTLEEGRGALREDFYLSPGQAANRVRQGIALADFLHAFRIGQVALWESIVDVAAQDPETERAVLPAATHVMQVIEVGSTVAAEAYLDSQQTVLAEGDRVRRDLVEDLLAGREVPVGPRLDIARSCGLEREGRAAVLVAVPSHPLRVGESLREMLRVVRTELGPTQEGLAVIRQEQMIGILPMTSDDIEALVPDLRRVHERLARQGVELTVGISTVHTGWSGVPAAYAEAGIARGSLGEAPGVVALSMLSTVDYLVLRDDPIARRVIRQRLREFVLDDLARDGAMIETLQAYVASDLNAKLAAERMHMHVNTAYYRLDRIAQRTGCDLRRFADVEELVFAVRLLAGPQLAADFRPKNQ